VNNYKHGSDAKLSGYIEKIEHRLNLYPSDEFFKRNDSDISNGSVDSHIDVKGKLVLVKGDHLHDKV
jgi:hypothetical protein